MKKQNRRRESMHSTILDAVTKTGGIALYNALQNVAAHRPELIAAHAREVQERARRKSLSLVIRLSNGRVVRPIPA